MPPTPPDQVAAYGQGGTDRFVREPECQVITGLSRTTRWRLEKQNLFPKRRQISAGTVGWLESEVLAWLAERAVVAA